MLSNGLEVAQVKFQDVLVETQFMSEEIFLYKEWIRLSLSSN